jgi:hypothetical protein
MNQRPVKKKKWDGIRSKAVRKIPFVQDSYQADQTDLVKIRRLARKVGISKSEAIRACIRLGIADYIARHGKF